MKLSKNSFIQNQKFLPPSDTAKQPLIPDNNWNVVYNNETNINGDVNYQIEQIIIELVVSILKDKRKTTKKQKE